MTYVFPASISRSSRSLSAVRYTSDFAVVSLSAAVSLNVFPDRTTCQFSHPAFILPICSSNASLIRVKLILNGAVVLQFLSYAARNCFIKLPHRSRSIVVVRSSSQSIVNPYADESCARRLSFLAAVSRRRASILAPRSTKNASRASLDIAFTLE